LQYEQPQRPRAIGESCGEPFDQLKQALGRMPQSRSFNAGSVFTILIVSTLTRTTRFTRSMM